MRMKVEFVPVPVADVDRAMTFTPTGPVPVRVGGARQAGRSRSPGLSTS